MMTPPRWIGIAALALLTVSASVPLDAKQARRGGFSGDYVRLQIPELFTYDELVTLGRPDPLPAALATKLRTLTTTPFISNVAFYRGARPHHPVDKVAGTLHARGVLEHRARHEPRQHQAHRDRS